MTCSLKCKEKYLTKTVNVFEGNYVYICVECKRYYIKINENFIEVSYNSEAEKWNKEREA